MKKFHIVFLLTSLCCVSCSGDVKSHLGLRKSAPDEFTVISNPPLSVPPNFDLKSPDDQTPATNSMLLKNSPNKKHERQLDVEDKEFLDKLGETTSSSHAKKIIDGDTSKAKKNREDQGIIRKTISGLNGSYEDSYIDSLKEQDRIQTNLEEGKPINEGQVPTKTRSTLSKLFD